MMTSEELRAIKDRLDVLYSKSNALQMELKEVTDEIFNLELDILLRLREE